MHKEHTTRLQDLVFIHPARAQNATMYAVIAKDETTHTRVKGK
jgi:hypothetical protein